MIVPRQRAARGARAALTAVLLATILTACSSSDDTPRASGEERATPRAGHPTTTGNPRASGPSAGCDRTTPAPPGTTDERITSGGKERSYQLVVPDGYDGTTPLPVVFGLHSLTVDYHVVPALSGFGDMDDTYDFIDVSPSGLISGARIPYWNAAPAEENHDLDFLTELLDHLESTLCIDTARVYAVGMSNGAQMSSLLACRFGDRIAGIAPIAGVEYNEPCDGPPIPVVAFHGARDPIVPYTGGGLNSVTIADQNLYHGDQPPGLATPTGVDQSMRRWAAHNGCDPDHAEERISPEIRRRTWPGCDAPTVLYIVDNGGHAWPGKPQPAFETQFGHGTTDIDATTILFDFLFNR